MLYTRELNKKAQQPRRKLGYRFPRRYKKKKIIAKEAKISQQANRKIKEKINKGKNS